ncbi:MAG TPA: Crp/Fnr family transcriptional regulator [Chitinophagaceae bacterium]|jgi:CRP/FNR family transcriptional regulator|nr:Crp/Fnr family transcriptional regulator [Chitinophagaceae bacterium]
MNTEIRTTFSSFENDLLESLENKARIKTFEAGENILKTGQYFKSILLIVEGLIKVYREDEEGNEYFMHYLEPGQACILSMIHAGRPEKSEVIGKVVHDTTVIAVPPEYMDQWMHEYKTWYRFVIESYRKRFDKLLATVDHTAFRSLEEKLVHYLDREREMYKSNILVINRAEIARELNSSREVISRLVKKLVKRGMIRVLKQQVIEIIKLDS